MGRGLDRALRFVYVLVCPAVIAVLAALVPISGILINAAIATGIALAGPRRWEERVQRIPLLGRSLANLGRLGDYYEAHPPRPLLYYVLYPLFAPYWLVKRSARQELFIYRRLGVLALLISIVASAVEYLTRWAPLPFKFFAVAMGATLVLQLVITFLIVMPLVTTVIVFHHEGRRRSLVTMMLIGVVLGGIMLLANRRNDFVPLPTQERVYARAAWKPDEVRAAVGRALAAAIASLQTSPDVPRAELAARRELASVFRADELRAFHVHVRPGLVMVAAHVTKKHVIWQAQTPTGPVTQSVLIPDDVRRKLKLTDPAPWP